MSNTSLPFGCSDDDVDRAFGGYELHTCPTCNRPSQGQGQDEYACKDQTACERAAESQALGVEQDDQCVRYALNQVHGTTWPSPAAAARRVAALVDWVFVDDIKPAGGQGHGVLGLHTSTDDWFATMRWIEAPGGVKVYFSVERR